MSVCVPHYVREIMVPIDRYPEVDVHKTTGEAIHILKKFLTRDDKGRLQGPRSLVVTDQGKTVGLLNMCRILKALSIKKASNDLSEYEMWMGYILNRINNAESVPIKDIVLRIDQCACDVDAPAHEAALLLIKHQVDRIPVTENGKVVGVVRTVDIFHIIADIINC